MTSLVSVSHVDRTAVITYANPPSGLIRNGGAAQLAEAVQLALNDPDVRVLILTGQADVFIRHADVSQIARAAQALADGAIQPDSFLGAPFDHLGRLIEGADKPVIAAINGSCMGGGLEIALACHMRIAATSVQAIGLPEIRLDIFPGAGGPERLSRLIGPHQARLFMLDGQVVDATRALDLGLIDRLAPDVLASALEVASTWSLRHPQAVAQILQATCPAPDYAQASIRAFADLLQSDPAIATRLAHFVAQGEALEDQD